MASQIHEVKEFGKAIEALKAFEKRDQHSKPWLLQISFIYFLEGDIRRREARGFAARARRYNAQRS